MKAKTSDTTSVIARSLRRRRTDILYVGESSLDVGEQTGVWTKRGLGHGLPYGLPVVDFLELVSALF